jgi:hypothetical protein
MRPAREGLLSTIRALMEMTESRGCTGAEAAIASAKARQLMDKHDVTLKELLSSAGTMEAHSPTEPRQKPSRRPRTYEFRGDAFANEGFTGKRKSWNWEPLKRACRVLAGYGAVGFGIWAIAAFQITPSQQEHPYKHGRGVSDAGEPIIGDGANSPSHEGQVRYWHSTFHEGKVEYFGKLDIRPVPDN